MRILMISAEGPPLQRAGAVIDVMDGLPAALRSQEHEVCVVLPFYREISNKHEFKKNDTGIAVDVQVGDKVYGARYLEGRSERKNYTNLMSLGTERSRQSIHDID